jgi:hypothetical protein
MAAVERMAAVARMAAAETVRPRSQPAATRPFAFRQRYFLIHCRVPQRTAAAARAVAAGRTVAAGRIVAAAAAEAEEEGAKARAADAASRRW